MSRIASMLVGRIFQIRVANAFVEGGAVDRVEADRSPRISVGRHREKKPGDAGLC
jgi:hypothetical protein